MSKEILQITIKPRKQPKTKFGRWFDNKIWFPFWYIWRPKAMSKFFWGVSEMFLRMLPKTKREELRKEYDEIDAVIVNKTQDEKVPEYLKEALSEYIKEEEEDVISEAVKKALTDLKNEI